MTLMDISEKEVVSTPTNIMEGRQRGPLYTITILESDRDTLALKPQKHLHLVDQGCDHHIGEKSQIIVLKFQIIAYFLLFPTTTTWAQIFWSSST